MSCSSKIGAFFDVDGTLLPKPSLELRFCMWLLGRGKIKPTFLVRQFTHFARCIAQNRQITACRTKEYLAGLPTSLVSDWANSLRPKSLGIFRQALALIFWHVAQQHRVFIVSGTLAPLAHVLASQISSEIEVAATQLEVADGCWTGSLASDHLVGPTKCRALKMLALKHDVRLDLSYAYGNSLADFSMLHSVGHPHAANPSICLRRAALKRKWPVSDWESHPASRKNTIRNFARELS